MKSVLSIFTGAGLLDRGFEQAGFFVVSGGDVLWGRDVRDFAPASHIFQGVIGGPPCPDFSKARRTPATGYGLEMIKEFCRVVEQAGPDWFLMENVPGVPDVTVQGFTVQRLNLNASECGVAQNRLRCFQFGSRDGVGLVITPCVTPANVQPCVLASEGNRPRRSWADVCALQGLPRDFSLPGLSQAMRYRLVGNGVAVPMARVVATAIARRHVTRDIDVCVCDCGRPVQPGQTQATAACRKRMQRKRDAAGVGKSGPVTV
jgi:DNA (cytosine-5)-methyltransferase 1